LASFGFLTVLEDPTHGLFGGYLIVNEQGRPQEFHCTTPVLPTRAQQILYGPTLQSYLMGEVLGQSLVAQAKLAVQAVLVDREEILSLAWVCDERVICVAPSIGPAEPMPAIEPTTRASESRQEVLLDGYRLFGEKTDQPWADLLAPLVAHVDLAEPFQRICEAIREAQRITHLATEGENEHGQSAAA